nr:MAG TPA: hypothetical protein [Caudoviricetes sp.]
MSAPTREGGCFLFDAPPSKPHPAPFSTRWFFSWPWGLTGWPLVSAQKRQVKKRLKRKVKAG